MAWQPPSVRITGTVTGRQNYTRKNPAGETHPRIECVRVTVETIGGGQIGLEFRGDDTRMAPSDGSAVDCLADLSASNGRVVEDEQGFRRLPPIIDARWKGNTVATMPAPAGVVV